MSFELSTDGPRLMRFPYPVCWAGATVEECKAVNDFYFTDRIEICLRLSSAEPEAVDEIDGRIYRTRFPHVFFKHPFHRLRYSYVQPRNAVHFSYAPETLAALRKTGCFPPDGEFFREFRLTPELEILIRRFTELLGHTMERNALDRLDLTAYELLCELLLERNAPPDRQEFRRDDILAIASYLKQSFRHEIDYERLAHRHGLSPPLVFPLLGAALRGEPGAIRAEAEAGGGGEAAAGNQLYGGGYRRFRPAGGLRLFREGVPEVLRDDAARIPPETRSRPPARTRPRPPAERPSGVKEESHAVFTDGMETEAFFIMKSHKDCMS